MFSPGLDPDDADRSPGADALLREEPDEEKTKRKKTKKRETSTMMRVTTTRMEGATRYPPTACVGAEG